MVSPFLPSALRWSAHQEERSGKWSSFGCQINFTKSKWLFSSLIPVWISRFLVLKLMWQLWFWYPRLLIFLQHDIYWLARLSIWTSVSHFRHASSLLSFTFFFFLAFSFCEFIVFSVPVSIVIFSLQPNTVQCPVSVRDIFSPDSSFFQDIGNVKFLIYFIILFMYLTPRVYAHFVSLDMLGSQSLCLNLSGFWPRKKAPTG